MSTDERLRSLKLFDESKAGVKGIADSGTSEIPHIFKNKDVINCLKPSPSQFNIPVIDLEGVEATGYARASTINRVRDACQKWGFFQIINHGVPSSVMAEMMVATRRFHEQDAEVKKQFYSRDNTKTFLYNSNFDLYEAPSTNWRDTFQCILAPHAPDTDKLPTVCRDVMLKYSNYVKNVGLTIFELLSEALGLKPNHLKDMGTAEGLFMLGHYYPPCPEPDMTLGFTSHSDSGFITILLQDEIGGLQVQYENEWIDVPHIPEAFVVNVADMLQLISNDAFRSSFHRVVPKSIGPRISVACLFVIITESEISSRLFGPIKELLSDKNSAIYREVTAIDFVNQLYKQGFGNIPTLTYFKL
ncbi:hypothetical protein Leryth_024768 [Lithospermum erythrorhizon]|nr:hypothetical protein Leryth_024768 [Lithospermum erythrorhizon]